ncbi:hypothetical protein ACWCQN_38930, partial [Streptomyces sp. NPDC001984]|uniref:hypothetical protein n=1 Tax=Streptomyces sp. NPDC002619 TaxID=3364655 RepID=UPI0036967397
TAVADPSSCAGQQPDGHRHSKANEPFLLGVLSEATATDTAAVDCDLVVDSHVVAAALASFQRR